MVMLLMIWNKEVESKASKLVGLMQALALNVPAGSLMGVGSVSACQQHLSC